MDNISEKLKALNEEVIECKTELKSNYDELIVEKKRELKVVQKELRDYRRNKNIEDKTIEKELEKKVEKLSKELENLRELSRQQKQLIESQILKD